MYRMETTDISQCKVYNLYLIIFYLTTINKGFRKITIIDDAIRK